jgi:hypothetical protein
MGPAVAAIADLWYIHRESILAGVGVCLLVVAAAAVTTGTDSASTQELATVVLRTLAVPVVLVVAVTYVLGRWYWFDEDASWRELTPEGLAVAGALSVCMAIALGGPAADSGSGPTRGIDPAAVTGDATATRRLQGSGFTASYPSDWTMETGRVGKAHFMRYAMSTGGSAVNRAGIAGPGELGLSVYVTPADSFAHPPSEASDPSELLSSVVGIPDAASNVRRADIDTLTLGGQPAVSGAIAYTYKGTQIIQDDVVAPRQGRVFLVEVNRISSLATEGDAALHEFLESWRWSVSAPRATS